MTVTCAPATPPCEGGETCNPGSGLCELNADAPLSTPCDADAVACTDDHCDGSGSCVLLQDMCRPDHYMDYKAKKTKTRRGK